MKLSDGYEKWVTFSDLAPVHEDQVNTIQQYYQYSTAAERQITPSKRDCQLGSPCDSQPSLSVSFLPILSSSLALLSGTKCAPGDCFTSPSARGTPNIITGGEGSQRTCC